MSFTYAYMQSIYDGHNRAADPAGQNPGDMC